jgi:cysteine desulfurase
LGLGRSLGRVSQQHEFVYLDHAATTPMRQVAIDAMLPFLADRFANPSGSHRFAREARRAVDDARDQVAAAIGCLPGEIVFTSGGTESDNAAIAGAVWHHRGLPVCPATEHHGVLNVVERHDGRVVGVDSFGRVDPDALTRALDDDVAIVSVMAVNNEVGSINDLAAVSRIVRDRLPNPLLHTDAVQAASWLDLRDIWPHVDLLSLSAHKFGGPKGVGVLAIRKGVHIDPLIVGGGHERDRRSGTHNVPGIVAMAAALAATDTERARESQRVAVLRDRLLGGLLGSLDGVRETVPAAVKVPGGAHVCVEGVESESLLFQLEDANVCASAASACASGAMERSHVLAAMGVQPDTAAGALRMTLGRTTTDADVDRAIDVLVESISTLRARRSPVAATRS